MSNKPVMHGFTLIEVVVLVGISSVVLIALVNFFIIFNSIYGYQRAFMATAGSAGRAMNALQGAVLPAEAVLASHNFSGTIHTSATTSLVLQLPSVNSAGNIIPGVRDYIVFYASSTELYRRIEAESGSARISGQTILSTTLDSIAFTYDSANFPSVTSVMAEVKTSLTFKGSPIESHLTEVWHLRNAP